MQEVRKYLMTRQNIVIRELRKLAHQLFANKPAVAYLYGSHARGDYNADSDWDILILTEDSVTSKDAYENFAYPFTEIGWRLGEQITPILYTKKEWDAEAGTAFFLNVQNEAIPL